MFCVLCAAWALHHEPITTGLINGSLLDPCSYDACGPVVSGAINAFYCYGTYGAERTLVSASQLVKWLHLWGMPCTVRAMDGAAGGGHLELVQWLAANRRERCTNAAFDMAAAGGHLDVIQVHGGVNW